jgi:hypothetical protein
MSTFYASFPEASKAEVVALALLSEGVQPDDISLVSSGQAAVMGEARGPGHDDAIEPSEDATSFVGRADDPDQDKLIPERRDSNAYMVIAEADTGAGISTFTPDDAASDYQEVDDIESIESDMLYPPADRPNARHEVDDLQLALETGFPTNVPVIDDFKQSRLPGESALAHGLETIPVPGLGVVMGGGALATAALDLGQDSTQSSDRLLDHLRSEGVPTSAAQDILSEVTHGGAILAVSLVPGEVDVKRIEDLAAANGASQAATYDAPRY